MDRNQKLRYNRHLIHEGIGEEGQERLLRAKVLIVGVGGLGSPIALYLAAAGVGTLGLVDGDTVSISNLQRQVLYTETEIGESKTICAERRLKALNSDVCIETYPYMLTADNAEEIIEKYDIVVDGTDNFAVRFLISDTCHRLSIPYVYGAIRALEGQVAILCKGKATYRTLMGAEEVTEEMSNPDKSVVGTTPAIIGSIEASQVLQLICGYGDPLIDRLFTIDLSTLNSFIINL